MTTRLEKAFVDYSCNKLRQLSDRICICIDKLSHDQIWLRSSDNENAVQNLVLHLCGNVRQWIGSGVGGAKDTRERDLEFSARGGIDSGELKELLCTVISDATSIIRGLTAERLEQTTRIQGYEMTVLEAVYHVVEHFSGHAGQIIFSTKHITGQGLAFYSHLESSQPHRETTP